MVFCHVILYVKVITFTDRRFLITQIVCAKPYATGVYNPHGYIIKIRTTTFQRLKLHIWVVCRSRMLWWLVYEIMPKYVYRVCYVVARSTSPMNQVFIRSCSPIWHFVRAYYISNIVGFCANLSRECKLIKAWCLKFVYRQIFEFHLRRIWILSSALQLT